MPDTRNDPANTTTKPDMIQEYYCTVFPDQGSKELQFSNGNLQAVKTILGGLFPGGDVRYVQAHGDDHALVIFHKKWAQGNKPAGSINRIYVPRDLSASRMAQQQLAEVAA
jgi:hypothetical protein